MGWVDFFILFFWITLGLFFFNVKNFITILLYAELTWLIIFSLSSVIGAQLNEITSMSFTFFILGFGGLEFVIGLLLVVLLKNLNFSISNSFSQKNTNTQTLTGSLNNFNTKRWNI